MRKKEENRDEFESINSLKKAKTATSEELKIL
jgi:hypothetical protein